MATRANDERSHTTVTVRNETYERLKRLKPYDSISYNELICVMADEFDSEATEQ
jgi:hypothetical protein